MASSTLPPAVFTAQLVVMLTPEQADGIARDALVTQRSKSQTAREYLATGAELQSIATEHGVALGDLVNAARLHALRATAHDGVEVAR